MQKILLIGYLGKDPEMKYTPGGTAITTFTIASTERWKNGGGELQEHTEWFNIKASADEPRSLPSSCTKAAVSSWKAGSGPSPGTTRSPAGRSTGASFTSTKSSSWANQPQRPRQRPKRRIRQGPVLQPGRSHHDRRFSDIPF